MSTWTKASSLVAVAAIWSIAVTGHSQVVQLPTIQTFSYSGSVLVPDRGSTSLGSVSRSGSFSSRSGFGPLSRRRDAGFASRSNLSVSATIIDHDAIDRQIRGLPPRTLAAAPVQTTALSSATKTQRPLPPNRLPPPAKPAAMIQEGKSLVRFARRRYDAGDHEMAKVGYQMAIAKLDGTLLDYAVAEYRSRFGR